MRAPRNGGFTLVESMIAVVILAMGLVGIVAGLLTAARELREGQMTQFKAALADASIQRLRLEPKASLLARAGGELTLGKEALEALERGAAPWALDPSAPVDGDLGTGAYFRIQSDGTIERTRPGEIVAGTSCASVPRDVYCRELLLARGVPPDGELGAAAGGEALTVWVRVGRGGDRPTSDATRMEVVVR